MEKEGLSVLIWLAVMSIIGYVFSGLTSALLDFIPYWVAGCISISPLYAYMKSKKSVYRLHIRNRLIYFVKNNIISVVVVTAVFVFTMNKANLANVIITSVIMSFLGLLMIGLAYSLFRALYKAKKHVEIPHYVELLKQLIVIQ